MSDRYDAHDPVSLDLVDRYIFDKVFPLRPGEYCKKYPKWPGQVGLEIEMMPLISEGGHSRLMPMHSGEVSLDKLLVKVAKSQAGWEIERDVHSGKILRVKLDKADQLTFEPGGQLEFSSAPYPCLSDALKRMREVQAVLDQFADNLGIRIQQGGINPWQTTDEIGLQMDKPRYQGMTRYFNRIGPYGVRMMRQTCTIQINLDFGPDEQTMMKRFMLSQLLAPFATAIFANSPCVDGKLTDKKSYRSYIWQHVDGKRTGFDPKLSELGINSHKTQLVEHYREYILGASVVFIEPKNFETPPADFSFKDWIQNGYDGIFPTVKDFETHLSLHFPEVRLRGFLELRSMDAQSRIWQSVPAGFNTSLFYDEQTCDEALEILLPLHGRQNEFWKKSSYGFADDEVFELSQKIFKLSMEGLQRLPSCFREEFEDKKMSTFWDKFTARRRSPADDMIDIVTSKNKVPDDVFTILDDMWTQY